MQAGAAVDVDTNLTKKPPPGHSEEAPQRQTAVLLRSTHLQEATSAFREACAIATQLAGLQGRLAGQCC